MPDPTLHRRLEDELRLALREEVALLPLTVTPGDLRGRQAGRGGAPRFIRLLATAAMAAGAVVVLAILFSSPLDKGPDHGGLPTDPGMSTPPPDQNVQSPRPFFGGPETAIIHRIVADGEDFATWDLDLVALAADGSTRVVQTIPDVFGRGPEGYGPGLEGSAVRYSEAGYVAVAVVRRDAVAGPSAVLVYDLGDVHREPLVLEGIETVAWGPRGMLAGRTGRDLRIVDAVTGATNRLRLVDAIKLLGDPLAMVWADDGSGLLAQRLDDRDLPVDRGVLGTDGFYRTLASLPRAYLPTGRERLAGAAGERLLEDCADGCRSVVESVSGDRSLLYAPQGGIADQVWTGDGRGAWILEDLGEGSLRLVLVTSAGEPRVVATFDGQPGGLPAILGVARDDDFLLVGTGFLGGPPFVQVDARAGVARHVQVEGSIPGFAGWAAIH